MSNVRQKKTVRHHRFDRQNIRIPMIKIKKEPPEGETSESSANIRPPAEFAENAMSEILGWYGAIRRNRSSRDRSPRDRSPVYPTSPSGSHKSYSAESEDDSCSTGKNNNKQPAKFDVCGWCSKTITTESMFSIDEKSFCSEVCFTQCRRASFKKNKTCDWCRHIRHTVNYVDFQQLQFCSNKCLNQYKMNIFCKETQEHLELHPHPAETEPKLTVSNAEDSSLITPELWMNNHEDSPPPPDVDNISSSDTPSPPLPHYTSKPLNGAISTNSKMKTIRAKKKSKLLDKQNFQMKFKKLPHHFNRSHPLPFYRSPFPPPTMFDLPAFRNPPPLLRILRPSLPPQPSPAPQPSPSVPNLLPPPTTLVPYPFIVPLPIPIPIVLPLPISPDEFHRIFNRNEMKDVEAEKKFKESDMNDCQTNKPMKKRKKVTGILYGASISEKAKDTIIIHTDEKDDMSSSKESPGNQSCKKQCTDSHLHSND